MLFIGRNDVKIRCLQPQQLPFWGENNGKIYLTWNPGTTISGWMCQIRKYALINRFPRIQNIRLGL